MGSKSLPYTRPVECPFHRQYCFQFVCANVSRIDWVEMVQKSVDDDIVTIQRHPAVLYEYRRFIVVKGTKDPAVTPISVCDPLDACKYLW